MSNPCRTIHGLLARIAAALRDKGRALAGLAFPALVAGLSGCEGYEQAPPPVEVPPPTISVDPESGLRRIELSVMTYNIWGLPWPATSGRPPALRRIAAELRRLQEAGEAPDILLLQEAFTPLARQTGRQARYPHRLSGPRRGDRPATDLPPPPALRGFPRILKGEGLGKVFSSGLEIFSRYPLTRVGMAPFGRHSCAGYDCLANKGVMLALVEIPGVPQPVQILNTHLNAGRSSGVALGRAHAAHRRQVEEITLLLERHLRSDWPFIFAGDFNTRNYDERFANQDARIPGRLARRYCVRTATACKVRMRLDGEEPWKKTQNLQRFADGSVVRLRPLRLETMFDGKHHGRKLSDHKAYLVVYELTWSMADQDRRAEGSAAPRKGAEAVPAASP